MATGGETMTYEQYIKTLNYVKKIVEKEAVQ